MRAFATALAGGAMAAGATIFLNNTNLTEAGKQALLDAAMASYSALMALQCSANEELAWAMRLFLVQLHCCATVGTCRKQK